MRLYSVEIVVRLDDDDKPDIKVNVEIEDGVPTNLVTETLSSTLRGLADQMDSGKVENVVVER